MGGRYQIGIPGRNDRNPHYDSVGEARRSIGRYFQFYNGKRPHSSLDRKTPDQVYFQDMSQLAVA
jgi:putative transposase